MSALRLLEGDDFLTQATAISTAQALYDFLNASKEVDTVRTEIRRGSITIEDLNDFIRESLKTFKTGYRFQFDTSLAALSVACGLQPTKFASQLIDELAELNISEIPFASRIANLVKEKRTTHLPTQTDRKFSLTRLTQRNVAFRANAYNPAGKIGKTSISENTFQYQPSSHPIARTPRRDQHHHAT